MKTFGFPSIGTTVLKIREVGCTGKRYTIKVVEVTLICNICLRSISTFPIVPQIQRPETLMLFHLGRILKELSWLYRKKV